MAVGVGVFVAVCVGAVIGFAVAGWPIDDALYMVVISVFGVGYGEVRPVSSGVLRALTMSVIVVGYGAVIYAVGGFIQFVVDGELNNALGVRRMNKETDALDGHTIICGLGRMGHALAQELREAGHQFVAIDTDDVVLSPDDDFLVLRGDATHEEVLERAGIARAAVVASMMSDDAQNVFVTVTAREMNPDVRIIARGESRRTESKLRSCGADTVVMPTAIGASAVTQMITAKRPEQRLDWFLQTAETGLELLDVGLRPEEIVIPGHSPLAGRALADLETIGGRDYLVVGVRRTDGSTELHPAPHTMIEPGDSIVVLGHQEDLPSLVERVAPAAPARVYRGVPQL